MHHLIRRARRLRVALQRCGLCRPVRPCGGGPRRVPRPGDPRGTSASILEPPAVAREDGGEAAVTAADAAGARAAIRRRFDGMDIAERAAALTTDLSGMISTRIRSGQFGVMVASLTRGDTLFAQNAVR